MHKDTRQAFIPTYFSHSYRSKDREINHFFWELFWETGFLFTVDPKSDILSIPYLEYIMQRSACFAAVIPCRSEQKPERCSPFSLWEYGLAIQAQKPRLVFIEENVNSRFFSNGLEGICIFNRDRLNDHKDRYISEINKLKDQSHAYSEIDVRLRGKVGIILPIAETTGIEYASDLLSDLENLLDDRGYTPEIVNLEFNHNFELNLRLDQYDFVIIDIATRTLPFWVYPHVYGRFIPSIKLLHLPPSSEDVQIQPLISGQFLKTGSSDSDSVLFWRDKYDLFEQINKQLDKFDTKRVEFHSYEAGSQYFKSLGLIQAKVFISNAKSANKLAGKLAAEFSARNIEHFQYMESNTIPLGSDWEFHLNKIVEDSDIFIPLVTHDYEESKFCAAENKIASERATKGRVTIIPYFLDKKLEGTFSTQGRDIAKLNEDDKVNRILIDVELLLTSEERLIKLSLDKNQTFTKNSPVDVAIITILPEEYKAVLDHLDNHERATPEPDKPDLCAWMIGEINSPAYERPFRVVVALAQKAGNVSGAQVTSNTVMRWDPRYVVLTDIAGGLPKEGLKKGDVVVSSLIWGYEYGKVKDTFEPRTDFTYQVDNGLLRNSSAIAFRDKSWVNNINYHDTKLSWNPKVIVGPVASGDKVIDNANSEFFKCVIGKWPKIQAIEMEGAGAAAAISEVQSAGRAVGFIMIRGISDMPLTDGEEPDNNTFEAQSDERNKWKIAASESAATFVIHFIRNSWPLPPRKHIE